MKRTLALATLLASGLTMGSLTAIAQTAAAPAAAAAPAGPTKIAIIMFQVAVAQTNEGQRNFADVQKKFEPKRAQLKTLSDDIDTRKKQLQAQGDKLSPAETSAQTKKIDEETKELQRSAEDAQNDYQQAIGEMYNTLASKVFDSVQTYAKEQGFTLVLDASQQQSPVLWAAETTNITQPVIAAYNAKSGVPAPPPGAPSAIPSAPRPSAPKAPAAAPKN
jgi:outer membrane protein